MWRAEYSVLGMAVAELANMICHIQLAEAKPPAKGKPRKPPSGLLFNLIACPHFLSEIMSWAFFVTLFPCYATCTFNPVGAVNMAGRAKERQAAYVAAFPTYTKAALIPGIF